MNYDELWKEVDRLAAEHCVQAIQPHERVLTDLCREWKVSESQALKAVQKLVAEGRLGHRRARSENGREVEVYFPL